MKATSRPCVVLCDYPIKTMAYQRFLSGLGESAVFCFRQFDLEMTAHWNAKLVVCDMNIMATDEANTLREIEQTFPRANILCFEEDHSDMRIKLSDQRDICCLGKLAEINVIYATLKELLLQSQRVDKSSVLLREQTSLT